VNQYLGNVLEFLKFCLSF